MSRWQPEHWIRPRREHLFVGLDAQDMAWQRRDQAPQTALHADPISDSADFMRVLTRHTKVDVIAANDVAVHWVQTPPASVRSLQELRQIAAARCAYLFGGTAADWWVAADWSATQAFVCAGLPMKHVTPLEQALSKTGACARWHTVWGLIGNTQARSLPDEGWCAARSPERVLLWFCRRGCVMTMASMAIGTGADAAMAREAVMQQQRIEALRDPLLTPGEVHWASLPPSATAGAQSEAGVALALAPLLAKVLR